jgi:hypothetical protein
MTMHRYGARYRKEFINWRGTRRGSTLYASGASDTDKLVAKTTAFIRMRAVVRGAA